MFENGKLEELGYSRWFTLLVASALYTQRSVLSLSMASFHVFFLNGLIHKSVGFGSKIKGKS